MSSYTDMASPILVAGGMQMYYSQVDIKMTKRLPILQGVKGPRIFHEYHEQSNQLLERWDSNTLVFLVRKALGRFEFTFYVASRRQENFEQYIREYVTQFGGDIGRMTTIPITEDKFLEGLARARYMGYLRNGKEICVQMENKTE